MCSYGRGEGVGGRASVVVGGADVGAKVERRWVEGSRNWGGFGGGGGGCLRLA